MISSLQHIGLPKRPILSFSCILHVFFPFWFLPSKQFLHRRISCCPQGSRACYINVNQEYRRLVTHSPHFTVPFCSRLPAVASSHADPRYQAFFVLSLLLVASEPQLRFRHLVELTSDSGFPRMRMASVGLLKKPFLKLFAPSSEWE